MLRARFTRLDFPIINTSRLWFSTGNVSMSLLLPAELPCSTVPFPLQGCCSDCICFECCWEQGTFRRSWSKSWLSLFPLLCPFWPQLCHAKFMEQSTPCSWEYLLCSPRVVLLPFPPSFPSALRSMSANLSLLFLPPLSSDTRCSTPPSRFLTSRSRARSILQQITDINL